jgi:predicted secreted protein
MRRLLTLLLFYAPFLLLGCGPDAPPPRPRPGYRDTSQPIAVKPGQEFEIVVPSNATTGYHWRLKEPMNPSVGSFLATEYLGDPNPKQMTGVGGTEYWAFKALKVGTTKVVLRYSRTDRDSEDVDLRTFTVIVQ